MQDVFEKLNTGTNKSSTCFIMGDFNIDLRKIDTNINTRNYANTL